MLSAVNGPMFNLLSKVSHTHLGAEIITVCKVFGWYQTEFQFRRGSKNLKCDFKADNISLIPSRHFSLLSRLQIIDQELFR